MQRLGAGEPSRSREVVARETLAAIDAINEEGSRLLRADSSKSREFGARTSSSAFALRSSTALVVVAS